MNQVILGPEISFSQPMNEEEFRLKTDGPNPVFVLDLPPTEVLAAEIRILKSEQPSLEEVMLYPYWTQLAFNSREYEEADTREYKKEGINGMPERQKAIHRKLIDGSLRALHIVDTTLVEA